MKLIIFDLDGTLIDTLQDLANSCNHALQENGYPTHPTAAYKIFIGNGVRKLVERALPLPERNSSTIDQVLKAFTEHYHLHSQDHTQVYPDIYNLLAQLKKENYALAVASNKYHAATVPLVALYFGDNTFDLIFGHREGHPPKPDPDIVFDILQRLKISQKDCAYLGDSSVDMQTAKQSGVTAVGVSWGFRTAQELSDYGADHIIHQPLELLNLLEAK